MRAHYSDGLYGGGFRRCRHISAHWIKCWAREQSTKVLADAKMFPRFGRTLKILALGAMPIAMPRICLAAGNRFCRISN